MRTELENAYWAGMLDGEGSIIISKTRGYHFLRVMIYQNKKEVLEEAQEYFQCGSIYTTVKEGKRDIRGKEYYTKSVYCWHTTSNNAEMVLRLVIPYLKIKKEQAEMALEFQEYSRETSVRGRNKDGSYRRLSEETLDKREKYKLRISMLNKL